LVCADGETLKKSKLDFAHFVIFVVQAFGVLVYCTPQTDIQCIRFQFFL